MNSGNKKIDIKFHILAIICIIVFCISITPKTLQNDTFYTIRIGELIVNNGIDMQDHFSWHKDLAYTYPHWLYDVGIYGIFHLGEITGLQDGGMLFIYISTIILCCTLGLVIYATNCKLTKNKLVSFFITLFAMYLLKDFVAARAQLVTFILFVLTILFIENFLESNKKTYLIGIIIISLLIANLHCAVWPFFFVLFLPYIAEYIIAWIAEKNLGQRFIIANDKSVIKTLEKKLKKLKEEEKKNRLILKIEEEKEKLKLAEEKLKKLEIKSQDLRQHPYKIKVAKKDGVKWLVLVLIICALTGLLTPLGNTPYTYLAKTMKGNTTKNISEHLPLTLYDDKEAMTVLVLFLMMLIFTDVKIKLSDLFMLAGLVFLSFMTRRQVSMVFLIGGFIFSKLLTYLAEKYDKDGCEKVIKFMTMILGKILTLSVIALLAFVMIKPKLRADYINQTSYPVAACDWILENLDVKDTEKIRFYNEYNYGSYLLYKGIPVFIDSRADLYAPEFNGTKNEEGKYEGRDIFTDYMNTSTIGTYYETKFEKYDITHVIVNKKAKLNLFLSRNDNYIELYKDDNYVIYERDC